MIKRKRNAKILATLGPSSSSQEVIEQLFSAGADVFRLNFSHGTVENHYKNFQMIRELSKKTNRPIGVCADLQGPKFRIGQFKNQKIFLQQGKEFILDQKEELGDENRVTFPHPEIFSCFENGTKLLLDDGKIALKVTEIGKNYIKTQVITGGCLSDRKGVNIPEVMIPVSALTKKDLEDLKAVLEFPVDWIALSFVQKPEDILEARHIIGNKAKIVTKIEKPLALKHLNQIIELSDAIIVARGDLGVEMPPEEVPSIQKRIIQCCREAGVPVVVATQMLESMIHSPTPTRAEASDVATAIYEGVDAVMLSAESAAGEYPIESVTMMNKIIERVEKDPLYRKDLDQKRSIASSTVADAISAAAREIADVIDIKVITTLTASGSTTLKIARERPHSPIVALTANKFIANALSLVWGVHPVVMPNVQSVDEMIDRGCRVAFENKYATFGEQIIITGGIPFGIEGTTNMLRIAEIIDTDSHKATKC